MRSTFLDDEPDDRERWNTKYSAASGTDTWTAPDPFLLQAFSEFIVPRFPSRGNALDLAGGAGRHAIWLAQRGWDVTLMDISETGIEQARRSAAQRGSDIRFVLDDLTHFQASQSQFDLVMAFYYLERDIFPEIVKAIRPGGLLLYKTHIVSSGKSQENPMNPSYLLAPGELPGLATGLRVLLYREQDSQKPTAELVAAKEVEPR